MDSISSFSPVYNAPQVGISNGLPSAVSDGGVDINYNSQDEFVMAPQTIHLPSVHAKDGTIEGDGVKFVDENKPSVTPNQDGSYSFEPGTKEYANTATMATVQKTIDSLTEKFGKFDWAFGESKIGLNPDGGNAFNAFYSRQVGSVYFFHGKDPVEDKTVYTGASGEVVSHEVGHAVLDAVRPGFLKTWKADTNGFHEAFGDITALYMSTQDDAVCQLAAKETGGDLRKPNCLSRTGEQLGHTMNNYVGQNMTGGDYIRSMISDYKWQDPSTVDPKAPSDDPDPLTTEMHSWSRIFTGAQYDILTAMVDKKMEAGMDAASAIKAAGNDSMAILADAIKMTPQVDASYHDVAMMMLKADANNGGEYHDIILSCMQNRNILGEGDDTPSDIGVESVATREMTITLGNDCGVFAGAEVTGTVSDHFGLDDTNPGDELAQDLKQLIQNGCILYTEPNQKIEIKDLFDKNGNPYIGVVRWTEGKMVIERNQMIA